MTFRIWEGLGAANLMVDDLDTALEWVLRTIDRFIDQSLRLRIALQEGVNTPRYTIYMPLSSRPLMNDEELESTSTARYGG